MTTTDPPQVKELVTSVTPAPKRKHTNLLPAAAASATPSNPIIDDSQDDDDWETDGMSLRKSDPVGECITQLLNEGKVPYFGYCHHFNNNNAIQNNDVGMMMIGFSSPILSTANYYACKRLASKLFSWTQQHNNKERLINEVDTKSSFGWFLIETMAAVYIAVYALNDVTLRFTMSSFYIAIITILSAIVDVNELQYVVLLVIQKITPKSLQTTMLKWVCAILSSYHNLESSLLYGSQFKNRVLPWRDEERIVKFRRKHLNTMKLHTERRRNRRARRKFRTEMRKKERRGMLFDDYDVDNMHKENIIKETLDRAIQELRKKPPTYFSSRELCLTSKYHATISDTTRCHFHSLEYCHRIIFQQYANSAKAEVPKKKPVSITTSRRMTNSLPLSSPVEAIELEDQFPDIQVNTGDDYGEIHSHCGSVSSSGTQYSLPSQYDFKEDNQYFEYDSDSDEDESLLDGEDENTSSGDEDELSQVSDGSGEVVNKMDWITVGAKIGSKILQSRQVHRVISNPSRKILPEEAKKLMDGIQSVQSEERFESSLKTSTFDSQYSKTSKTSTDADTISEATKSTEVSLPQPKRPVHGMWTSAGSASKASSQYGAVTLPVNNLPARKIFASSTQESVELVRESSDGRNGDKLETERNALSNGSQFTFQNLNTPYNLRQVTSLPSNGAYAPKNELTPKASNLVANKTPPQTSTSSNSSNPTTRLAPMEKGVKIVVPLFAPNVNRRINNELSGFFQMGTVLSSARIAVTSEKFLSPTKKHKWTLMGGHKDETNCLEVKLVLDKAILRGCRFAEMTIRIMDEWNWVPRFSKYPIGSCVATTFGIGVLVGWRVEDDMHIIRSLWNRSGPGSGLAYLRRECLHSIVEAAVGFDVQTRLGSGFVEGYVRGGKENTDGKYFVHLKSKGRYQDRVIEFKRSQIISCRVAKFIPVTEHIRAAALYQLEILHYKSRLREHMLNDLSAKDRKSGTWRKFSEYVDLFSSSLSKAIADDPEFDKEWNRFLSHIINLLDDDREDNNDEVSVSGESVSNLTVETDHMSVATDYSLNWRVGGVQEIFSSFFVVEVSEPVKKAEPENKLVMSQVEKVEQAHDSITIVLRVLLRTVAVARASVPDRPKLHIALAMIHEGLLFMNQLIRVNKNNISRQLIEAWFRTLHEISKTFGPLKKRLQTLGKKMSKKMKKHSNIAKKRTLSFVDIILADTMLLHALERGDWRQSLLRVEYALVKAGITDEATCEQLHKGALLLYRNLAPRKKDVASNAAARRTEAKAIRFAKFIQILASPGRSFLRLLASDDILDLFGRVLLRIFDNDEECSMMINIFAFNFHSLRYLRTLNNLAMSAKLWGTILDSIDEELTFVLSEVPEQTKYFIEPFIKLFSLGVAKFHLIMSGDSNADWLDFLFEEEAIKIIHDIDSKLIDCLDAFVKDVKQLVEVMPYIETFDNDVLDLMDELDFDLMFKEITGSISDPHKFTKYITERTAVLVERFLDYLPRMSIPIEKRELQDGWVLTCRGNGGGDLRLSDINIKRENLLCRVLGSDNVFKPLGQNIGSRKRVFPNLVSDTMSHDTDKASDDEECVLSEVREMIVSAQEHGCWVPGFGGLRDPFFYLGVPLQLEDLPLSDTLKTSIDLWQSDAISDFEFTQIVIREVSRQIELHSGDEKPVGVEDTLEPTTQLPNPFKPMNPKIDPTVLLLEIKNLSLHLDEFIFRVEKGEHATIFDPVFEGVGSLTVQNVCISLKVEIKKERERNTGLRCSRERPILHLAVFDISLEEISISFKDTGADWVLNTVLKGFRDQITHVVQVNVKDQIENQVRIALDHVNDMFDTNSDLLLRMLGTSLEDLERVQHV